MKNFRKYILYLQKFLKFIANLILNFYFKITQNKKYEIKEKYVSNPNEVIYVPTKLIKKRINLFQQIKYKHKYNFNFRYNKNKERVTGLILDGNWDKRSKKYSSLILLAFKQRFIENLKWEKTCYYKKFKILKNKNGFGWNCKNYKEFKNKKLYNWDKLYQEIKNNGYKSQKEINGNNNNNEIQVAISRKGEILFIDGNHRLAIAKILQIKKVPVIVNVWHKKYFTQFKK